MINEEELDPRRKPSKRRPPSKAKHKHDYETVCLCYQAPVSFDKSVGFVKGEVHHPGLRCRVCGNLKLADYNLYEEYDYNNLPHVQVENIFKLH